eukprot:GHVT01046641.1.p1 GENE.GHVT01046641.1~~GHVT01046641.1.p1  ORF type:complete len:146 (+),score=9.49 GHVT01046641.1:582-1019(+)
MSWVPISRFWLRGVSCVGQLRIGAAQGSSVLPFDRQSFCFYAGYAPLQGKFYAAARATGRSVVAPGSTASQPFAVFPAMMQRACLLSTGRDIWLRQEALTNQGLISLPMFLHCRGFSRPSWMANKRRHKQKKRFVRYKKQILRIR